MNKKIVSIILMMILCLSSINTQKVYSIDDKEEHEKFFQEANVLKALNLFQGTDNGFELNRYATRIEAGILMVRLLGLEKEALEMKYKHPFIDVPQWADDYIGLMYELGLTEGVAPTLYGAEQNVTPEQFATFCLRSLGYDDAVGDFYWKDSLDFSETIGYLTSGFVEYIIQYDYVYRDDTVVMMYNLLNQKLKDGDSALIDQLISQNVFTLEEAMDLGVYQQPYVFQLTGTVKALSNIDKVWVVDTRNQVKFIVSIPFSSYETAFVSYLLIEGHDGNQYECFVSKEGSPLSDSLQVKDQVSIQGDLVVHMAQRSVPRQMILTELQVISE